MTDRSDVALYRSVMAPGHERGHKRTGPRKARSANDIQRRVGLRTHWHYGRAKIRYMTSEEFGDLLAPGHETVSVEFKPGVKREANELFHRVVRGVLAMANMRGGGRIVLGIQETTSGLVRKGVPVAARPSWKYDDVSAALNGYADPFVRIDRDEVKYKNRTFIILRVHEFDEYPVLCRKGEQAPPGKRQTLKAGACYVRSTKKPESIEVPSQTEMRELIDLAVEKGVRKYLARKLAIEGAPAPAPAPETDQKDRQRFDEQRGDFR